MAVFAIAIIKFSTEVAAVPEVATVVAESLLEVSCGGVVGKPTDGIDIGTKVWGAASSGVVEAAEEA